MHPAPGFRIVILGHVARHRQRLEPVEVGTPGALQQATGEMGDVATVEAVVAPRRLEELGDPLIEPQGHRGHDGVNVAVRRLMPQVFGDPVLPGREH